MAMHALFANAYWQESEQEVLKHFNTSLWGISEDEARRRLRKYGKNEFIQHRKKSALLNLLLKFRNPLVIILLIASLLSASFGEISNFVIITLIICVSVAIDFVQERSADASVEKLKEKVSVTATVMRNGIKREIPLAYLVIGDVIILSAGDIIPADARIIDSEELLVDESLLTGESYPREKRSALIRGTVVDVAERINTVFMGTHVQSGSATAVIVRTGSLTELGSIADHIQVARPETEFERGVKSFGYLLMKTALVLVIFVFFVNAFLKHNVLESFLFALALAVGLTPELLPMIVTINSAKGALRMAKKSVIVKHLPVIQSFGSMNVFCTDKTGTLTENVIVLERYENVEHAESKRVLLYGYINAVFQAGLKSPLEEAVLAHGEVSSEGYEKVQELPFDFFRKRLSVIARHAGKQVLITKGAPEEVFSVCDFIEKQGKQVHMSHEHKVATQDRFYALSKEGYRVLAVAYRFMHSASQYSVKDEEGLTYLGLMAFYDPPKKSAKNVLMELAQKGVEVKILTGDGESVTKHVCDELELPIKGIALGKHIEQLSDHALGAVLDRTTIFARLNPMQKNRIILLLKQRGAVVGYLGDGINDAPSLRSADIGISVNNAVDIAKESADVILLKKDLEVLLDGVEEGRRTYGNIMKYIMMGTSSNFGNMVSVAGASLFLPFLPMLPVQILLNNLLYDFSELAVSSDHVDAEYTALPKRWDISSIKRFMLIFGSISSVVDFATFFVLFAFLHAGAKVFQTGWFVESLVTQSLIMFSIRTRMTPFFKSRPSTWLAITSITIALFAVVIPFTPLAQFFSFAPLPVSFYVWLVALLGVYIALVEGAKKLYYTSHE